MSTTQKARSSAPTVSSKGTFPRQRHLLERLLLIGTSALVLYGSCAGWPQGGLNEVALVSSDLVFLFVMTILWRG